jgi:hypothetical protein
MVQKNELAYFRRLLIVSKMYLSAWREMQNNRNRKKFDRFKAEVQAKYKPLDKLNTGAAKVIANKRVTSNNKKKT